MKAKATITRVIELDGVAHRWRLGDAASGGHRFQGVSRSHRGLGGPTGGRGLRVGLGRAVLQRAADRSDGLRHR